MDGRLSISAVRAQINRAVRVRCSHARCGFTCRIKSFIGPCHPLNHRVVQMTVTDISDA